MQNFTLHCHTNFGGYFDGRNSVSEMIEQAQKLGFQQIGISNHLCCHQNMPLCHPMFFNDFAKAEETYQAIIEDVRASAIKSKIKVLVGFEVDFFPSSRWRSDFEKMISNLDYDYLIGACHNLVNNDETQIINPYVEAKQLNKQTIGDLFPNYWRNLKQAIESGYFTFMAHLDLYKIFKIGCEPEWDQSKMDLIEMLAKYNQPYEVNTSGWNKSDEQHPHTWMIKELNKRDVPVLISDDAHSTTMIGQHFIRAEDLLSEIGYKTRWKMSSK